MITGRLVFELEEATVSLFPPSRWVCLGGPKVPSTRNLLPSARVFEVFLIVSQSVTTSINLKNDNKESVLNGVQGV